jgi:tetratricopeptide (TPR) repeat protein
LYQQSANFNPGVAKALESALKLDPSFSEAWALLSSEFVDVASDSGGTGSKPDPAHFRSSSTKARRAAQQAVAVSPNSADAHVAMARLLVILDWDFSGAQPHVLRALAFDPENPWALAWKGVLEGVMGRPQAAYDLQLKSLERDPLNFARYNDLYISLFSLGRFRDAADILRKQVSLGYSENLTHALVASALLLAGDPVAAQAETDKVENEDYRLYSNAMIAYTVGDKTKANQWLDDFERNGSRHPYAVAELRAYRGENDLAFKWLERAYGRRDAGCIYVKSSPFFKGLHADARWAAFLRKMKLPVD